MKKDKPHKHEMETKYGEFTEDGKYRNVIKCRKKNCEYEFYSYVKQFDKK